MDGTPDCMGTGDNTAGSNSEHAETSGTRKQVGNFKILYLFGGPYRPSDGFEKFCQQLGSQCEQVDIEFNPDHDLTSQSFWDHLSARLDDFDAYLISPPCSTFTAARNDEDGGPGKLRSVEGPGRYGLGNLNPEDKHKVRIGTLLALRGHAVASHAQRSNKPWILEQPHMREDGTSMFRLDEFQQLLQENGVRIFTFAQCRFGSDAEKLTDLMSNQDLDHMVLTCNHEPQIWIVPWNGRRYFLPHAPLRGRQRAIKARDWNSSMLRQYEPTGPYVTKAHAAYPAQLNRKLALSLVESCLQHQSRPHPGSTVALKMDQNLDTPKKQ